MMKEEIWSIAIPHARNFFRAQPDVSEESMNCYIYKPKSNKNKDIFRYFAENFK